MKQKTLSRSQVLKIPQRDVADTGNEFLVGRNSVNEISLPKIKDQQKYETTFKNLLPNYQKINRKKGESQSFLQKYSQLCKQKQYFTISDEDIIEQNKHLKSALREINDKVDKTIKDMSPKIDKMINKIIFKQKWKERTMTETQFLTNHNTLEHRKKIQNMEASNNEFMIKIYKNQYRKLKNREKYILDEDEELRESMVQNDKQKNIKIRNNSSIFSGNSRVRERLHSHIQQTVDVISKTRVVNMKIKERSRTIGNSIHSTDEFILSMKKLFESVELQQRRKKKLQKKVAQTQLNITQVYRNLSKIQSQWSTAEEYLQKINKKQQNVEQNKQKWQTLKKKQAYKDLSQKKKEFQLQNHQFSYHNMLKNLDKVRQSIKDTTEKLNQIQLANAHQNNEINSLQTTLLKIKKIKKQQLNKKRTGTMILSNQLFSQYDINSQKSSMNLNQQMTELLIQERIRPNVQVQTQNNERGHMELNEDENLLQNKNKVSRKSTQNVKNQSETLQ